MDFEINRFDDRCAHTISVSTALAQQIKNYLLRLNVFPSKVESR